MKYKSRENLLFPTKNFGCPAVSDLSFMYLTSESNGKDIFVSEFLIYRHVNVTNGQKTKYGGCCCCCCCCCCWFWSELKPKAFLTQNFWNPLKAVLSYCVFADNLYTYKRFTIIQHFFLRFWIKILFISNLKIHFHFCFYGIVFT